MGTIEIRPLSIPFECIPLQAIAPIAIHRCPVAYTRVWWVVPVLFLSSLSLLFAATLTNVRIFRIDSGRCTRGIASIHLLQPERDAIMI
jgi:hypothetical protein